MMTLNEATINQELLVLSPQHAGETELSDVEARLMQLGFIPGARVAVRKKTPLFASPLLVEVRGRWIALTKEEAGLVSVQEAR
jgi:Fe2+ transport system protein FeoA